MLHVPHLALSSLVCVQLYVGLTFCSWALPQLKQYVGSRAALSGLQHSLVNSWTSTAGDEEGWEFFIE